MARSVTSSPRAARASTELIVGKLEAHGVANYQFRDNEEPSYYVKLLTTEGTKTLWGKDLKRALSEAQSRPQIGDQVGARRVAREAVTITARERDAQGNVIAQAEHLAHRTRWVVEKAQFLAERTRLARQLRDEQADVRETVRAHPELRSAFLSVRAAEAFADERIRDPQDRAVFLARVRDVLAGSIQRGEPLPDVRLKNARAVDRAAHLPSDTTRSRDARTR